MEEKPTYASVTDQECSCNYLRNAAEDPDNPIIFETRTNEYQFTYQHGDEEGRAMLVIYHCPFCGGTAPRSKRALLFAAISQAEEFRLAEKLEPIKTLADAIAILGEPDYDGYSTSKMPEEEGTPPKVKRFRDIRYEGLSDVASVWITERSDQTIYWTLHGKPLVR